MRRRAPLALGLKVVLILGACSSIAGLASNAVRGDELRTIALASPKSADGAPPDGCRSSSTGKGSPAHWQITSAEGTAMVTEGARVEEENRFPICVVDTATARNFDLSAVLIPMDGVVDQAGGLIFRLVDDADYYLVRLNALERDVRFFRVEGGVRTEIMGVEATVLRWTHHLLRVTAFDDRFAVKLDGRLLFEARDGRFPAAGRIGIWSKSDSLMLFGELELRRDD